MVLRKITNDNTVRHFPISQKLKERDFKPKTMKAGSLASKQNKNLSQINK